MFADAGVGGDPVHAGGLGRSANSSAAAKMAACESRGRRLLTNLLVNCG
jgi:hypothetical protein